MNTEKKPRKRYEHKTRDPSRSYQKNDPDKFHVRPLPDKLWPARKRED